MTNEEGMGELIPEPQVARPPALGAGWKPAKDFSQALQERHGQKPMTRRAAIDRVIAIANGKATPTQIFELAMDAPVPEGSVANSIDRKHQHLLVGIEKIKVNLESQLSSLIEAAPAARLRIRKAARLLFGRIFLVPTFGNAIGESVEGEPFVIPVDVSAACDYVVALLASDGGAKWTLGRCQHCHDFFVSDNQGAKAGKRRRRYCTPDHMKAHHALGAAKRKQESRANAVKKTRKHK